MNTGKYRILFICSGNSCRTPMAEGLMKLKIPDEFSDKVEVVSAGTLGIEGNAASPYAVRAAEELGADISSHRSQGVSEELMESSDIIFCMAQHHQDFLTSNYPAFSENVFLLRSFDNEDAAQFYKDVDDPIGRGLPEYQHCASLISNELDRILPRLKKLIETKLSK